MIGLSFSTKSLFTSKRNEATAMGTRPSLHRFTRQATLALLMVVTHVVASRMAEAQLAPDIGWHTELSTDFHDVSGTVRVLDANTLQFEDFTYDGEGIVVHFYLAEEDRTLSFIRGLSIGEDLVGTPYDGTQPDFTIDLPSGSTIDGYNAISVWCVTAGVSFGSGTFVPPTQVPEPSTTVVALVGCGLAAFVVRRRGTR